MTNNTTLSIFVDESGNLPLAGTNSRFYIVSLVAHNQQERIDKPVRELDEAFARMELPNLCFHAGPLIRREDGYKYMAQLKVGIYEFLDAANLPAVADFKIKVYYEAVTKPGRAACPHAAAARPESAPYRIREVLQLPLTIAASPS